MNIETSKIKKHIEESIAVKSYIKQCLKENRPIDESKIGERRIFTPISWQKFQ